MLEYAFIFLGAVLTAGFIAFIATLLWLVITPEGNLAMGACSRCKGNGLEPKEYE